MDSDGSSKTSAFSGREPDENRKDFDFGALDSVSGRAWFLPTTQCRAAGVRRTSEGAEAGEGTGPRVDVNQDHRVGDVSIRLSAKSVSASTIGWGRNSEIQSRDQRASSLETMRRALEDRHTVVQRGWKLVARRRPRSRPSTYDRRERSRRRKIQGWLHAIRRCRRWIGRQGLGATVSASIVPGICAMHTVAG